MCHKRPSDPLPPPDSETNPLPDPEPQPPVKDGRLKKSSQIYFNCCLISLLDKVEYLNPYFISFKSRDSLY